jgi:hypothetical protein
MNLKALALLACCAAVRAEGAEVSASTWQVGYRFVRWTEAFEFRGTVLTETTNMKTGPTLSYLFTPASPRSWYLGAALYRWTREEESERTGSVGKAATTTPFLGGGYRGRFGTYGYFNLGLLLTTKKLTTETLDSSEESTGADAQVQIGFAF